MKRTFSLRPKAAYFGADSFLFRVEQFDLQSIKFCGQLFARFGFAVSAVVRYIRIVPESGDELYCVRIVASKSSMLRGLDLAKDRERERKADGDLLDPRRVEGGGST
jgi:hypothetical protein